MEKLCVWDLHQKHGLALSYRTCMTDEGIPSIPREGTILKNRPKSSNKSLLLTKDSIRRKLGGVFVRPWFLDFSPNNEPFERFKKLISS